jgi:uncharacterized Zn finger protein (UPF0148 family)
MTQQTWGHCEECGDFASIKAVDGDWLCPYCRGLFTKQTHD